MYIYIYILSNLLKYQKFMYPWGATVAFTSGFWGLISEASPATCPGQGAKIGSTFMIPRMISTKMGETRINIGCNIGLWKGLIFSYCIKICLDRVGHDYDSHDFDWRIWPIPALNHRSDFNLGGGVWGTFSRGFLWLRWSCLAGIPHQDPPERKEEHAERSALRASFSFVLSSFCFNPTSTCHQCRCCHGMPERLLLSWNAWEILRDLRKCFPSASFLL